MQEIKSKNVSKRGDNPPFTGLTSGDMRVCSSIQAKTKKNPELAEQILNCSSEPVYIAKLGVIRIFKDPNANDFCLSFIPLGRSTGIGIRPAAAFLALVEDVFQDLYRKPISTPLLGLTSAVQGNAGSVLEKFPVDVLLLSLKHSKRHKTPNCITLTCTNPDIFKSFLFELAVRSMKFESSGQSSDLAPLRMQKIARDYIKENIPLKYPRFSHALPLSPAGARDVVTVAESIVWYIEVLTDPRKK